MNYPLRHLCIYSGIALITTTPAQGQISVDGTPPTNINQVNNVFEITGGTTAGGNLFHSFQKFSVPSRNEAFFNNADTIDNIISRVTGGSISNIDGLIRARGSANLFLINPAGIIFGPNASLNIGGSFLGSTADSIIFPEGEFSAIDIQSPPLLTINAPIGLRFRDNPGTIVNRSNASLNGAINALEGLQVSPGQTLGLVGGEIRLEGGNLSAPGGRIELGSVDDNSLVNLTSLEQGFALGYEEVDNFQNIQLSQSALVDATDMSGTINTSGSINVQAQKISLADASQIFSINLGEEVGGSIVVNTSDSLELKGANANILTLTFNIGDAGDILIETKNLSLSGGAAIGSLPFPVGSQSGEVRIVASDSIELIGTEGNISPSAIGIQVLDGDGKDVIIETELLTIRDGAQILANTFGTGKAGNLIINASDIQVIGTRADGTIGSAISAQADSGATGDGGSITIETEKLTVQNGGFVSTSTFGSGEGGDLTVNASDFITLSGTTPTANLIRGSSGLFTLVDLPLKEGLPVNDTGDLPPSGNGGDLTVKTSQLIVENGAKVSAETLRTGKAGKINIDVDRLIVRNGGQVRASSLFAENTFDRPLGAGGTITINASDSIEVTGTGDINGTPLKSSLFTLAEGTGDAGNLRINTNTPTLTVTVKDGGEITASTLDAGKGGELDITAQQLTVSNGGTITARTSGTGKAGNIILKIADNVTLSGTDSGLFANTEEGSTGDGGSIFIDPQTVIVRDGATIAVNSDGSGQGGSIEITAENLTLNNGSITAETASSQGGNIILNVGDTLSFENSGKITATAGTAQAGGDGGNIIINADFILAFPTDNTYEITANAFEGDGGNIQITTKSFFGAEFVDISASSERGLEGVVTIDVLEVNPARGLTKLPSNIVDASRLIAKSCLAGGEENEFVVTGRGGLPANPNESLRGDAVLPAEWVTLPQEEEEERVNQRKQSANPSTTQEIVEARGWIIGANGNVILTAEPTPAATLEIPWLIPYSCTR